MSALQFSVLQVITTTPQSTGVSAAQWGRIRQSSGRTTVSPAPGTPPLISMVPQVSRSARVRTGGTALCFRVFRKNTSLTCVVCAVCF